jgi:vanillate O-demethylase ferredoxin subunit
VNPQHERHRYVITVSRDPASRGGSRHLHESLRVGDFLHLGAPRNNFNLVEGAAHSVFIAGGIGITPLWSMIQRLETLEGAWTLYYATRGRGNTAYLAELETLEQRQPGRVNFHFDDERPGQLLDMASVVGRAPPAAHLYCCGPAPMLRAFEAATENRAAEQVHLEYFSAQVPPATAGGFNVTLARTGKTIHVDEGTTILDALLAAKIDVPFSCREGTCGTCEVRVLEGQPDHRDVVLSDAERAANKSMMICCSGAKSGELVLDI